MCLQMLSLRPVISPNSLIYKSPVLLSMIKAFFTGHTICHTTNTLNIKFVIVHWNQASSLSDSQPLIKVISLMYKC